MTFYTKILIIGGGLIGSSLARAIQMFQPDSYVSIFDTSDDVTARLKDLNIADEVSSDLVATVADVDLIILATPVGKMGEITRKIAPHLKDGAVISDVGSVKGRVLSDISEHIGPKTVCIPAHPIAGTEQSGPDAGFAALFQGRWCILTPPQGVAEADVTRLTEFWTALGSEVTLMDAGHHDMVLATTSHVPHMIAYALVGTAIDMETVTRSEVVKFSAGGFRDFTRIAASDPVMWRDVFLNNREAVLEILDRYIEDLTALKRNVRWSQGDKLLEKFDKTRDIRRRIVDAGQDTDSADFGRAKPD